MSPLVFLSIFIASIASYVSFGIAGRITDKRHIGHILPWIAGGGIAMGSGIWAMHFIGMLAMQMPFPIEYHFSLSVLSLLVAILFSSLAFTVAAKLELTIPTIIGSSLLLGAGIASMHYIGMASMTMPAKVIYNPAIVVISIVIAVFASAFALTQFSHFKLSPFANDITKKIIVATIMGGGISAMHYTAMAAVTFQTSGIPEPTVLQTSLIISIVIIFFLIQGGGIISILMDENLSAKDRIIDLEIQFMQAQKMEAIGTLVSGISHDFNNMLSGILGNLYLMKLKLKESPDMIKTLESTEELGMHAAEIIKQLLAFSRKGTAEMTVFSLTETIHDAYNLAIIAVPNQIQHTCNIKEEELYIRGNKTQIQQVVMNLMNNASDALAGTERPMISCTLSAYHPDKRFQKKYPDLRSDDLARLSITDNGCGISGRKLKNIFEPFYTTKEIGKGTGLGLSMTFSAIQSYGGAIEVVSKLGEGTSFHIYLPTVAKEVSL